MKEKVSDFSIICFLANAAVGQKRNQTDFDQESKPRPYPSGEDSLFLLFADVTNSAQATYRTF
jgi:hypothetical protein